MYIGRGRRLVLRRLSHLPLDSLRRGRHRHHHHLRTRNLTRRSRRRSSIRSQLDRLLASRSSSSYIPRRDATYRTSLIRTDHRVMCGKYFLIIFQIYSFSFNYHSLTTNVIFFFKVYGWRNSRAEDSRNHGTGFQGIPSQLGEGPPPC